MRMTSENEILEASAGKPQKRRELREIQPEVLSLGASRKTGRESILFV